MVRTVEGHGHRQIALFYRSVFWSGGHCIGASLPLGRWRSFELFSIFLLLRSTTLFGALKRDGLAESTLWGDKRRERAPHARLCSPYLTDASQCVLCATAPPVTAVCRAQRRILVMVVQVYTSIYSPNFCLVPQWPCIDTSPLAPTTMQRRSPHEEVYVTRLKTGRTRQQKHKVWQEGKRNKRVE